jgi:hypothetical protein
MKCSSHQSSLERRDVGIEDIEHGLSQGRDICILVKSGERWDVVIPAFLRLRSAFPSLSVGIGHVTDRWANQALKETDRPLLLLKTPTLPFTAIG